MSLRLSGVGFSIGTKTILDDVSLKIEPGKLNALIGPNGAGKSTLLRIVLGLEPRAKGRVWFEDNDFHAIPRRDRARIAALVEQSATTEQLLDVHDVAMLGRIPHQDGWGAGTGEDETIVVRALEKVGMRTFADRRFSTLSGGEQQRVQIARALSQEPRLLLLDEPTSHLDINAQLSVLTLLREMVADGLTVLVTMHDLNLAAGFFDHLVALDRGRVVSQGTPESVLTPGFLADTYGVAATVIANPVNGRPMLAYGQPMI